MGEAVTTYFHTNIDCVKRLVQNFNAIPATSHIIPSVGDHVEISRGRVSVVEMKVVGRTWKAGDLHVDLHLPSYAPDIPTFEKMVQRS